MSEPYEMTSKERMLEFMQRPEPVVETKDLQFELTPIDIQTLLELNLDCVSVDKDFELLPKDYKSDPSMTLGMYQALYDEFVFGYGLFDNPKDAARQDLMDEFKSMFPDSTPFMSHADGLEKEAAEHADTEGNVIREESTDINLKEQVDNGQQQQPKSNNTNTGSAVLSSSRPTTTTTSLE